MHISSARTEINSVLSTFLSNVCLQRGLFPSQSSVSTPHAVCLSNPEECVCWTTWELVKVQRAVSRVGMGVVAGCAASRTVVAWHANLY